VVSVLMPTYNQAEYLPAALDGLRSQTFRDFELIVCDDGSTDKTQTLPSGPNLIRHTENRGAAAAINSAARIAKGDLMTWVSSDNVMEANWLERLTAEMTPSVGAVYSGYWDGTTTIFNDYEPDKLISDEACYIGPSFLIRADVWREAGEHAGGISHDYGHWLRVEEVCWKHGLQIKAIPDKLCYYRRHDKMAGTRLMHLYDAPKHQDEARRRRELAR
jgi:glycosyltransferase involved in cell wall biosynthesis